MKLSFQISLSFLIIISSLKICHSAKILGVFMVAAKSHYSLGNSLLRGLADGGHNVTMISPYEDTLPTKNGSYRSIVLTGFAERYEAFMKQINPFEHERTNDFTFFLKFQEVVYVGMERVLSHHNVQDLIHSNETFDVVIVEQFSTEAFKALAHHFKAHLVIFSSIAADSKINYVVGNPTMLSYTPQVDTTFSKSMNFFQRIYNTLLYLFEAAVTHWHWLPRQDDLVKRYFPKAPSIFELNYNVSLILINSHESLQQPVPLVPNIIPIGGFHIKKPKKLPKDLQEFLDNAEEGVIYVSFGSSVKAADLPEDKRDVLLSTFGALKQKILWKWEDDHIAGLPDNVKTSKWFPQLDVLAHPNVKLFITHGGILSLSETVYCGLPTLVVPIFGDQEMNAQNVLLDEYGLSISFHDKQFLKDKLLYLINELLKNPKYKNNAQYRSSIFHDRPMGPLDRAVYWIEYVLRHNGANHLRVAGLKLPWYKHYLVDVAVSIAFGICLIFSFLIFIVKFLIKLCTGNVKTKISITNKLKHN
ncbi:UDP-glycosyltransferase UGT5-like isoform X1 [Diorhabda sublineata]|uniref:UDP-glycosyltransferase UGT5-like isoform X1 n=2 Tax=Diorhabda sublineata TaxID=1163346 RepID=UPI0024E16DD7|nr:UDP-glycosyltransferase UGT5-like isoform X1 [Diorhabda sublineata]